MGSERMIFELETQKIKSNVVTVKLELDVNHNGRDWASESDLLNTVRRILCGSPNFPYPFLHLSVG